MTDLLRRVTLSLLVAALATASAAAADPANKFNFRKGDRVVFVGGTFAEREALFGYIETMLQTRFPDLDLTFRNLGYSADTAAVLAADNASDRIDDGNRATNRALNFGTMHKHLADVKADVILLCLGMADSFDGEAGLADFRKNLQSVIRAYGAKKYNGKSSPRLVLIGPIAHEKMGGEFPDPTEHNKQLKGYNEAMRQIAAEHKLPFVDLFTPTTRLMEKNDGDRFTFNGIHLTRYGYWAVGQVLAKDVNPIEGFQPWSRHPAYPGSSTAIKQAFLHRYPVPPPPTAAAVHRAVAEWHPTVGITEEKLIPGKYTLLINGLPAVTASAQEWAKGVQVFVGPLPDAAEKLRLAIVERNQQFFYRWRAVNGEYIYGRRAQPFGVVNFPGEMKQLDEIVAGWDARILKLNRLPKEERLDLIPATGKNQPPAKATARLKLAGPDEETANRYNQKQGYMPNGQLLPTAADPEEERKSFKLPDGYEINLFASEKDFPLHNPLAMAWDTKGRLWVTTMPTYPHYLPGQPPNDKLLILEDTKGTGKADKCTVFADKLYLPTGLEFGNGGVYVSQQPNLMFIKDIGDRAGKREIILHGFGSGDSHHAMHMFHWSPEGALHFQEGIFHRSNVETPWGVVRQHDAGIYRFQPKKHKLEVYVSYQFANPWGHVFDRWGQNFIADASGGANYFGLPLTGHVPFPGQHPGMKVFTSVVRPTCGCEIVSSRHFPPEVQGNFLVPNDIGFQGIKQHKIIEEGSGFTSQEVEPLLFSTDRNFRPVDLKFGPDGALYVVDWFNPLIGHMQHSVRDPGRDHYHGRIWRITYKGRALIKAPKIYGEPIPRLLDLLKSYEDRTRYRVRMELRERDPKEVLATLMSDKWGGLDQKDPLFEHNLIEALWVSQSMGKFEALLADPLMHAKDYHARAAVTRAIRNSRAQLPEALSLLETLVNDKHPRVRLEAVVALSYFPSARAAEIALQALKHPTDYYLDYGLKETMATLQPYWKAAIASGQPFTIDSPAAANLVLGSVTTTELVKMARSPAVYMALLTRHDVPPQYRKEALEGLAKLHKTDVLTELFAAVERIDQSDDAHAGHVLTDLAHMLTDRKADDLVKVRPRLEQLAVKARRPITRQVAYVTLATADGSVERVWQLAAKSADTLKDVVEAVPLLPDAKLRATTYPLVKPLLMGLPEPLASHVKAHKGSRGRIVRIELPGNGRTLTLAEVQVFSDGVNVALRGKARQSSIGFGGAAQRGIDGNTSGVYGAGGQTHTKENAKNPWWEVDLGREFPIEAVVIWNRTDGSFGSRLQGFKLSVLDSNRKEVFARVNNPAPAISTRFALEGDPVGTVRRAAVAALPSIPGHETEAFTTLAKFYHNGDMRDTVVRALRRIPRSQWPKEQVRPLIDAITAHVAKLSTEQRTEPDVLDALQLGNNLAGALPQVEAKAVRGKLGDLGVNVILLRTVPHKMAYDRTKVYAEAGKPVVIVLENADIMPHNLVLGQPGSLTELGMAADLLGTNPNAFAMNFIPKSPKVLHATPQLQPRETARLQFIAPKLPGEYPYVCTFPGHWRVMYGTLRVVPRLADIPEDELNPPVVAEAEVRPFVRNWTMEDLLGDLGKIDHGRSFQRGKAMFSAASCIQCHKVGKEGGVVGPDLNELTKKLADKKFTRADILREILEPSKVIDEKYQTHVIVTTKGEVVQGVILSKDAKKLHVVTNPLAKPVEIAADDVESDQVTKVSMMPQGLLVTLNKEEILDLMAYLILGANPEHPAFSNREPLPGPPPGRHRHEH